MASGDIYPILGSTDPVANTPTYTQNMRKALSVPRPVRGYSTTTITLGTATAMSSLPAPVKSPGLVVELQPYVGNVGGDLECLLTFGGWNVTHSGAGDVRLAARVCDYFDNEVVGTGLTGVDWLRQVAATNSIARSRTVTIPAASLALGGNYAELMYCVNGAPTTKSVGYGYVELTPLRWRYPS